MEKTKADAPRPVADIRKCFEYGHRWGDWGDWGVAIKPTPIVLVRASPPSEKPKTEAYRLRQCFECDAFEREDFQGDKAFFEPGRDPLAGIP